MRKRFCIIACVMLLMAMLSGCSNEESDTVVYESLADLEGCRIGISTGTNFDRIALEYWEDPQLLYVNSYTELIPALQSHKIDTFICDEPWIRYVCGSYSDITFIDEKMTEESYGFVFAKNDSGAALRDDFNAFMEETPSLDDTLAEMRDVWCSPDTSIHPEIDYKSLPSENGTLRVCAEVTNPPFEFYENERIVGYNIELLYKYCESRGYGLDITDASFNSIIPGVMSGKYDIGSSSFAITEERAESVNFSEPIYRGGTVAAILTENSVNGSRGSGSSSFIERILTSLEKTFIRENRWKLFINGIGITLLIAFLSLSAGTAVGFALYMIYRKGSRLFEKLMSFIVWLITGIPEVLFLLILFYIVFGKSEIEGVWVSCIGFSIIVAVNVYGMIKGGVDAIDKGQTEAALAMGYSKNKAFMRVVFPQALRYIMPNYKASIVSLIKSTAIVGYLAVQDLTKVSDIVRSRTYEAFFPLIVTAVLYFILAWLVISIVERLQERTIPIRRDKNRILAGIDTGNGGENND